MDGAERRYPTMMIDHLHVWNEFPTPIGEVLGPPSDWTRESEEAEAAREVIGTGRD